MNTEKQIKREVISILVDNSANVLTRISSYSVDVDSISIP
jgi:acetolactate synthase small subunit